MGICFFGVGGQILGTAINLLAAMRAYDDFDTGAAFYYLLAAISGVVAAFAIYMAGYGFLRKRLKP